MAGVHSISESEDKALLNYDNQLKALEHAVKRASDPVSDSQMITINALCDGVKTTYEMLQEHNPSMNSDQQNKFQSLAQKHKDILRDYSSKGPRTAPPGI